MIGSFLVACLAACQGTDETGDWLDWARTIGDADLSLRLGEFQADLSGELVLKGFFFAPRAPGVSMEEAAIRANHYDPSRRVSTPQMGGRFETVLDASWQDWLEGSVDFRIDRAISGEAGKEFDARLEQYWLRVTPPGQNFAHFQLGKFAAPFGNFIPRSSAAQNPFPTFPLAYDHPTSFVYATDTPAAILARRDAPHSKEQRLPVWEELYANGAMVFGNAGDVRYAAAVMNSAPASWPYDWELLDTDYRIPSVYLRTSVAVDTSTTLGASFARGPYSKWNDFWIPPGRKATDFDQTVWGLDASYALGHLELFAEGIFSSFQTAFANTLELWSYYVEAKYTFLPGFYGALRLGQIRFGTMRDPTGASVPWDRDTTRYEIGAGWFFTKNLFIKASYQVNDVIGGDLPRESMLMLELVLAY
jgi:hypothetical protein